jgi:hypothetical protein
LIDKLSAVYVLYSVAYDALKTVVLELDADVIVSNVLSNVSSLFNLFLKIFILRATDENNTKFEKSE